MNIASSRHFSKLAQDFIGNFETSPIKPFFPISPFDQGATFLSLINTRLQEYNAVENLRETIATTIRQYHSKFSFLSKSVEDNLTKLLAPNTVAIVTGQQVGILGGPLYTIYKALHTTILAKQYSALFPQFSFVPIFWQETEDHDFDEVRSVAIPGQDSGLKHISYTPSNPIERVQIGGLKFESAAIEAFFTELRETLPKTDFSEQVFELFEQYYTPAHSFAEAQAAVLMALLADDGLLVINANSRDVKSFASPVFAKEISTCPQLSEGIEAQSVLLSEHYHAQVEAKGMNLFLSQDGKRIKLQQDGDSFKAGGEIFSKAQLLTISETEPERLSMNVVMRPLVQDTILPTVAYVAGPGEIAYFAQFKAAYDWAGITMPKIVPRITLTVLEERFEKLVIKFQTSIESLIEYDGQLVKELLTSEKELEIASHYDQASETIEQLIESLRNITEAADASLAGALTSLKGKVLTQIKDFASKTAGAERKKQQASKQQFEKALSNLLPEGKLQERELNLIYFLNKYGLELWKGLKTSLMEAPHDPKEHLILPVTTLIR